MSTAFPGPYAPDQPEMTAFSAENPPSPDGAASQGGSGAAAFGGGAGYNLDGPAKKGQGEAAKPQQRNFGHMWLEASDEDKDEVVRQVAEPLEAQGVSLEGAVANTLKQGGPHAMAAAQRWGIDLNNFADMIAGKQPEGQGPTGNTPKAFKSDDDYRASRSITSQHVQAKKKEQQRINQRRAMGGFLMELGINILGSQQKTGGGAIGEGLKTTFVERRARGMEDEDRAMGRAAADRKIKREDRADEMAEETHKREGLEKITTKDGKVIFADITAGVVKDPDTGEVVRELTGADLSASSQRAAQDALARARQSTTSRLDRLLKNGDPQVENIQDALDDGNTELFETLKQQWIDDEVAAFGFSASESAAGTGEIDFSALPPE